eukprot:gene19-18_t
MTNNPQQFVEASDVPETAEEIEKRKRCRQQAKVAAIEAAAHKQNNAKRPESQHNPSSRRKSSAITPFSSRGPGDRPDMEEKGEAQDTAAPVKKASTAEPVIDVPLVPDLSITTQPPRPGSASGSSILSMSSVMSAIEMARETVENSSLESLSMEFQDRGDEVGAKYRYRIQWVCPFCFNELRAKNAHEWDKYERNLSMFRATLAALKIQAYFRMIPLKRRWMIIKKGVTRFQSSYHARFIRRRMLQKKMKEQRPFRIRLHDVELYRRLRDEDAVPGGTSCLGQFSATLLPEYLCEVPLQPPPERLMPMIDMLKVGATQITYQNPLEIAQGQSVPTGTVLLTVTVESSADDVKAEHKQARGNLYRMDVVLRELDALGQPVGKRLDRGRRGAGRSPNSRRNSAMRPESRASPPPAGHTTSPPSRGDSHSPSLRRQGSRGESPVGKLTHSTSSSLLTLLARVPSASPRHPRGVRYGMPKNCILFPAPPGNVAITFTISEVYEWPRALVVGQSRLQVLQEPRHEDVPMNDALSKAYLLLKDQVPRTIQDAGSNEQAAQTQRTRRKSEIGNAVTTHIPPPAPAALHPHFKNYSGGFLTWTILPSTITAAKAGNLLFLAQPQLSATKKRCYCVLVDRSLIVYVSGSDVRPKDIIDMRVCYVALIEGEIVKLQRFKAPTQLWFIYCSAPALRQEWFRCGFTAPYSTIVAILREAVEGPDMEAELSSEG